MAAGTVGSSAAIRLLLHRASRSDLLASADATTASVFLHDLLRVVNAEVIFAHQHIEIGGDGHALQAGVFVRDLG